MRLVKAEPSPLDTEPDADLLLAIFAGDEHERRLAARAFIRRYGHDLYGFCRQFRDVMGGEAGVSDLVCVTFEHAFERADTYNADGVVDRQHARARTLRWLTRIASNLIADWLSSLREDKPLPLASLKALDERRRNFTSDPDDEVPARQYAPFSDDPDEEFSDGSALEAFLGEDETPHPVSAQMKCLREALATLKERDREVLLMYAQYSVDGKQLRVPADVREGLCARWSTNEANLRAIYKRAKEKIESYVAEHC